jgi:hypothetical protein
MSGRSAVNLAADVLKKDFVCVAVNLHNGLDSDGERGRFLRTLNVMGNWFQVVTPDAGVVYSGFLNGVNQDTAAIVTGALKDWRALPELKRKPGAIKVPAPDYPPREGTVQAPEGAMVLRVYQRNLKRDAKGEIARITKADVKNRKLFPNVEWEWGEAIFTEPMPDVMWVTKEEWKSLVPAKPKKGDQFDVPAPIKMRLFRYHLINGTIGLPTMWGPGQFIRGEATLTVEDVSPTLRLRLRGSALMATDKDPAKAEHGYDTKVTGLLEYDPAKSAFTRFDFVSVGDWWGGDFEGNRLARPGKVPLGIAFELAKGDRASDFMPPKGQPYKDIATAYWVAEQEP